MGRVDPRFLLGQPAHIDQHAGHVVVPRHLGQPAVPVQETGAVSRVCEKRPFPDREQKDQRGAGAAHFRGDFCVQGLERLFYIIVHERAAAVPGNKDCYLRKDASVSVGGRVRLPDSSNRWDLCGMRRNRKLFVAPE